MPPKRETQLNIDDLISQRFELAKALATEAADIASGNFEEVTDQTPDSPVLQKTIAHTDREIETLIRWKITKSFAQDAIIGAEHDEKRGISDFTWIIDPIDGAATIGSSRPIWAVVIGCVYQGEVVFSAIHDGVNDEQFTALKSKGAWLNGDPISIPAVSEIGNNNIAVGIGQRDKPEATVRMLTELIGMNGIYVKPASGCIALAYLARGQLAGFVQHHLKAWDCLPGLLLVSEAGGQIETVDTGDMIENGGRVIASAPGIFDELLAMANRHLN